MSSAVAASGTKDETATIAIESLSHDGRGVAHIDGKVVFVEGVLPGEQIEARLQRRYRRYEEWEWVKLLVASPERRTPECRHFGVCGGCALQHLPPELQIHSKQDTLREQLKRIGKVEPDEWLAPLTGSAWGYRRRARLGVRSVPSKGGMFVGFRERQRSHLANLDSCSVLDPATSALLIPLRELIAELSCADRIPQIEVAVGDNARALVFRHIVPLTAEDESKLRAFGETHNVQLFAQIGAPDTMRPVWPASPEPLFYRLPDGTTIHFQPTDFIQVNADINAKMIGQAIHLLDPQPSDSVLDLFCGLGNFTLPLARRSLRVLGIENDAVLVDGARRNAERNGLSNVEFRAANLYGDSASWSDWAFNKLLLDPPRNGAIDTIKQLRAPLPERIVYISCYAATLARDAQYLVQVLGYRLLTAGVMDMFPHTRHVEAMALFEQAVS
ncbi:MAG TPA: 23S rRNA (uracil(1939)-C(5))-methyltransferase RlmD [Burkholderiales bacterium]|nr:23S rRNA (uracil(1939)-C(5))-methyltransferase RlmD [Burkholderiales bacterium]